MKLEFDQEADALYLRLKDGQVAETREVQQGVFVDYNRLGNPIGIEVLGISKYMKGGELKLPDRILRLAYATKTA